MSNVLRSICVGSSGNCLKILSECEIKPLVLAYTNQMTAAKQNDAQCMVFQEFCKVKGFDFSSEITYDHADFSFHAYRKALAKAFVKPVDKFYDLENRRVYEEAWFLTRQHFYPFMANSKVVSSDIAFLQMPKDTSPGPLARSFANSKGKFLDLDGAIQFLEDHFVNIGKPCSDISVFGACLKDELRTKEKVKLHKTRMFYCAPIEHIYSSIRLFYEMNQSLIRSTQEGFTSSAVGVTFQHAYFEELHALHEECDESFFDDINGYDTKIRPALLWEVAFFRFLCLEKNFQTEENWNRIANLYRDNIYTPLMLDNGLLISMIGGNPSGQYNTALDNTIILYFYFVFCWLINGGDPTKFGQFVHLKLFGDDSCVFLKREALPFLNEKLFAITMKTYFGMEVESSSIFEFLGHAMVYRADWDMHVPVLGFDRIVSSMYYGPRKFDIDKVWERATGLRICCFCDQRSFELTDQYCQWLMKRYVNLDKSKYVSEYSLLEIYGATVKTQPLRISKGNPHE